MKRLIISFEEDGNYYLDSAEIPKDISIEQAEKLIEMGIAYYDREKKIKLLTKNELIERLIQIRNKKEEK